jgi:hypothetical protein
MTRHGTAAGQYRVGALLAAAAAATQVRVSGHSGPPYPVVSNRTMGPYRLSVWTDPDATDDGSAGGQFWVTIDAGQSAALPPDTRAHVAIRPTGGSGWVEAAATPVDGNLARQFAALVMHHEGPFDVRVAVTGGLGRVEVTTGVEATYDLRPAPLLLAVYVLPFLLVGFLWTKRLLRRRTRRARL